MRQPVEVPGRIVEDVFVPARGFLPAREVDKGQVIRVIDVEGQQVPDIILFDRYDLKNASSCGNTVSTNNTLRITTGHIIYSKFCDPLATIIADTNGIHQFLGAFCIPEKNKIRFGIEGTHNCRSNFAASMTRYGLPARDIELDSCFCLFMNVWDEQLNYNIQPPTSRPGDYVDMRAERDLIIALSNCPSERNACNNWNPTSLRVVIYEPAV